MVVYASSKFALTDFGDCPLFKRKQYRRGIKITANVDNAYYGIVVA